MKIAKHVSIEGVENGFVLTERAGLPEENAKVRVFEFGSEANMFKAMQEYFGFNAIDFSNGEPEEEKGGDEGTGSLDETSV